MLYLSYVLLRLNSSLSRTHYTVCKCARERYNNIRIRVYIYTVTPCRHTRTIRIRRDEIKPNQKGRKWEMM